MNQYTRPDLFLLLFLHLDKFLSLHYYLIRYIISIRKSNIETIQLFSHCLRKRHIIFIEVRANIRRALFVHYECNSSLCNFIIMFIIRHRVYRNKEKSSRESTIVDLDRVYLSDDDDEKMSTNDREKMFVRMMGKK